MAAGMAKGRGQHREVAIAGASSQKDGNAGRLREASRKHRAAKLRFDMEGKYQAEDKAAVDLATQAKGVAKKASPALVQRNRLARNG